MFSTRATGEPVWPIEERPAPQGHVPGEWYSPTQPHPTKPAAYEMQNVSIDELIDFTPELRAEATEILERYEYGPLFTPPLHRGNDLGKRAAIHCPGSNGGTNIMGGSSVDPETGILYVASTKACSAPMLTPGLAADADDPNPIGRTVMEWVAGPGGVRGPQGLPLFKPPYARITAIDLNTGETLWWISNGDTPDRIKNHAALQGIDIGNTGSPTHPTQITTKTLLIYGEGRGGRAVLHGARQSNRRTDRHGRDSGADQHHHHDLHARRCAVHRGAYRRPWRWPRRARWCAAPGRLRGSQATRGRVGRRRRICEAAHRITPGRRLSL